MVKNSSDNSIIRKALDAVAAIDEEANKKKREQLAGLHNALNVIKARVTELLHQEQQLLDAVAKITGKVETTGTRKKRKPKAEAEEIRGRVMHWIAGNGKVSSHQLKVQFPELASIPSVANFLKPLIDAGAIAKEGNKVNTRYFAKK